MSEKEKIDLVISQPLDATFSESMISLMPMFKPEFLRI